MIIYVNNLKLKNFKIDDKMNVTSSENLEGELSTMGVRILKIIVGFCLYSKEREIIGENFHALLDNNRIEFDRSVVKAILELREKKYIEVSI